jgi:chemotaxis signal transduction protein
MTINQENLKGLNGLLIFEISKQEFCIDIQIVSDIILAKDVKIKINTFNEATIYLDDLEYKVIQLHRLLGYPEMDIINGCRAILVDVFGKRIAFLVDKVVEIVTTDKIFVENSLDLKLLNNKKYLSGVLKFQDRQILIPDLERISKELTKLANISTAGKAFRETPYYSGMYRQGDN